MREHEHEAAHGGVENSRFSCARKEQLTCRTNLDESRTMALINSSGPSITVCLTQNSGLGLNQKQGMRREGSAGVYDIKMLAVKFCRAGIAAVIAGAFGGWQGAGA
jgi:hypothetical protein